MLKLVVFVGLCGKTLLRDARASMVAFISIRCSCIRLLNIGRMKRTPKIQPRSEPWRVMVASYLKTQQSPTRLAPIRIAALVKEP